MTRVTDCARDCAYVQEEVQNAHDDLGMRVFRQITETLADAIQSGDSECCLIKRVQARFV